MTTHTPDEPGIVPETKSWTWVLEHPCPDCGLDTAQVAFRALPDAIREVAAAWPAVLERADVRKRPDPQTWSPLEYAAHVRDVFRIFDVRLRLVLDEDDPTFANWDQDATAVEERYGEQDPRVVSAELTEAAATLAAAFEEVPDDALGRTARRSDGARFTTETLGRYFIHDPIHHLWDVTRVEA
ncbi:DinB family protein [Plantibacter sp. Leaf314]|uniref:DinB family protein n=1 Tax=Plantibacter sp. Leaf314 TaxID=1736333 RepID=UPI00070103FF|nr:DinB family protein [Plantibacter sp. Leaf314]KQQ52973.1 methyltransferase type 12 [Plantibacter sp. Leaf314]